jgi:hypothetical protein
VLVVVLEWFIIEDKNEHDNPIFEKVPHGLFKCVMGQFAAPEPRKMASSPGSARMNPAQRQASLFWRAMPWDKGSDHFWLPGRAWEARPRRGKTLNDK